MEWQDKIAPESLFLPGIMTQFTPEERRTLIQRAKRKIVNNKWTGSWINSRPIISMLTHKSRSDKRRKITSRVIKGRTYYSPQAIGVPVAHLILLDDGRYPTEDDQCSHLCHNGACIRKEHLLWESCNNNMRRLRCQRQQLCQCRLEPKCLLNSDCKN